MFRAQGLGLRWGVGLEAWGLRAVVCGCWGLGFRV